MIMSFAPPLSIFNQRVPKVITLAKPRIIIAIYWSILF